MRNKIHDVREGAVAGGLIGGAIGTLFQGITFVVPGGRELRIAKMVSVIVPNVISLSGTAIGTIIGAAVGARYGKAVESKDRVKRVDS